MLNLLSRDANIEAKSLKGLDALQTVSGKGHADATQLLLEQGAKVDAPGPRNMTSLHRAAYNDHADVLEILLDYGADADLRDDDGWKIKQCEIFVRLRRDHRDWAPSRLLTNYPHPVSQGNIEVEETEKTEGEEGGRIIRPLFTTSTASNLLRPPYALRGTRLTLSWIRFSYSHPPVRPKANCSLAP